jgi:hypothetical protein
VCSYAGDVLFLVRRDSTPASAAWFGPGKYCGNIRTRSVTIGKDGKRHVGKLHTRRTCRIPPSVQRSVQLTFALN